MKVLLVNTLDIQGGAAKATYRLHKALLNSGIDSHMLVQNKMSDDYTVLGPISKIKQAIGKIKPTLDQLPLKLYKERIPTYFSPAWIPSGNLINEIDKIKPDIVHLNWVCGGMLKIEDIVKIKYPTVVTLHDNWLFTGGCHIMWDCEKYKEQCGCCPVLRSNKETDLSRKIFLRKKKAFHNKEDMFIVGVSKWITECSKNSTLLKDKFHITLPNLLDINVFKPCDKQVSRNLWNLPQDKKLVLFGAVGATSDINKGFKELSDALNLLNYEDIELVVFGSSQPPHPPKFGFKTHYLGKLNDDISLVTLYSAVDVMVVPSRQESFGQTATEAMACGTPVACFAHTGLLDIVDHKKNGYLANKLDSKDLATGISYIIDNDNYSDISKSAVKKISTCFDEEIVVSKYIDFYHKCLDIK